MRSLITASCFGIASAALLLGCGKPGTTSQPNSDPVVSGPRHPVTDKMKKVSDAFSKVKAPDFAAESLDTTETVKLDDLLAVGPVVLYSILDGCPCSTDFEPIANALQKRYGDKAGVVGLFTDVREKADKWAADHSTSHVILLDADKKIVKLYKQERSVYVSLIAKDGSIVKSWPGYSADMLIELDGLVQKDAGLKLEKLDTAYAPKEPASGCQIFVGEGFAPGDKP